MCFVHSLHNTIYTDCMLYAYNTQHITVQTHRAVAGLLMLHWAWGASVLVWTRSRINFIYLFELDPRGQVRATARNFT
jgi:hypothetical protein